MVYAVMQKSFNSGEWAPTLNARVDLAKYHSGAALLENFFVDYRGGASSRPGTRYILQCYDSANPVRLVPFQATFDIGYILEFGDQYIRFYFDGAPILEDAFNITGATQASSCVVTVSGHDFIVGDWIYIDDVVGMVELNGKYFSVLNVAGNNVTIGDLNGIPINSTGYTAYSSGGEASAVYTLASPYAAADLALIKFSQNVNQLIICHPSYPPNVLTLVTANNWTILPIVFGTTATTPGALTVTTTLGAGSVSYSYVVTSIDANGQESAASAPGTLTNRQDIRSNAGSNRVAWSAIAGAVAYNVYKSDVSYFGAVPAGMSHGFIGNTTGTQFIDSNIGPDYSQTPPITRNPFVGAGVASVTVTSAGTYTTVPTVSFTGVASDIVGSATAVLQVQGTPAVASAGTDYAPGDTVTFTNGVVAVVATVDTNGEILTFEPITANFANPGEVSSGPTPTNPVVEVSTSGIGTGAEANLTWGVGLVLVLNPGAGYTIAPTVTFSSGAATATATLQSQSSGNPSVPGFFQQRLVLAGAVGSPQTFHMSQPGQYYNFNISSPVQADNAISAELVSGQLNTIKALIPQPSGLIILTDRASWLVNGGQPGTAVTPVDVVANAQSFNGISEVPPIVANFDILYVQAKGSIVRDMSYSIYTNVYTGTDISVLSSHLFSGYEVLEWAWAEEPYKLLWAVRNDGVILTLTFLKEQEFVGWSHSVTDGSFHSIATITEGTPFGSVDAVYVVVEREIGAHTVKYIERFAERIFPDGVEDAWCVDCALSYVGTPESNFAGGEHLAGKTVTGLADGEIIPPFIMPASGEFSLSAPASKVVVGLPFTCDLQTLAIDTGDPTIQGKVKQIPEVNVRVAETLGLKIGASFNFMVDMKDLVRGQVSSALTGQPSQVVTDLVTGDARTILDSTYTVPGQYCIRQDRPYPASILGVIPQLEIGEGEDRRGSRRAG